MQAIQEWARADGFQTLRDRLSAGVMDWPQTARDLSFDLDVLEDPFGVVPIASYYAVFERAAQSAQNDAILFDLFNCVDSKRYTLFDYLFVCAPTLRDACLNWQCFNAIRTNAYDLSFSEADGIGRLSWLPHNRHGTWRQNMFARMGWAAARFEAALGVSPAPLTFDLTVEPPKNTAAFLEKYGESVRFNSSVNAINVPADYLTKRPKRYDRALLAIIKRRAVHELHMHSNLGSTVDQIVAAISTSIQTGTCTLSHVAKLLNMSERSLQRALLKEGTSFRKLSESVRKSEALRYLQKTSLPLKEVAYLLGFNEFSAFSRAVKNWFGQSPKTFRRNSSASYNQLQSRFKGPETFLQDSVPMPLTTDAFDMMPKG